MYLIMGGQLADLATALSRAYQMYEFIERSNRDREKFRQEQEGYAGRAVSREAMVEAEQLLNAHLGNPTPAAIADWEAKFGKGKWSSVIQGMRTGETRTAGRHAFASVDREFDDVGQRLQLNLLAVDASPLSPEMKAWYKQTMKSRAANRIDFLLQNPDISGDPNAAKAAQRAKADVMSMETFSVPKPPPLVPPAPSAPIPPALSVPGGLPPLGGGGVQTPLGGGGVQTPWAGGAGGGASQPSPDLLLWIIEQLQKRGGSPLPGGTQMPQFPGMPLGGPGTGFSPGHTFLR